MIQGNLAHALLSQFAPEGIEAARRLLVGRELDFEGRGLRDYLLETCTLMGERFPEYDEWLAASQRPRRKNTGRGSRSLRATPGVCCCSPSKS